MGSVGTACDPLPGTPARSLTLARADLMPDGKRKEALRKPIQGKLVISLRAARDLNHRAPSRKASKAYPETTVAIKIEGNERAVSHPSRNDKWLETFDIDVERANEVEITIYDTIAPGDSGPIGIMWLRVSDLMEGLRRQKVDMESQGAGWVTADKAARMGPRQQSAPESVTLHSAGTMRGPPPSAQAGGEGIDSWWSVEPAGAISMRLDFVKDTVPGARRPYDGIGRQGAVRKRKGDVFEMNGHQFVQRQFYQPIMCALCQEFLLTGEGYQCEDCRYACHKKCYPKVVTKCIGKATDGEGDEEKINHRIPHRFSSYTNMSANWCCHCGYMLPFGRKNSVKCSGMSLLGGARSRSPRMRHHMPSNMLPFRSRFLRHDHGNGQHSAQESTRYQDDPDQKAYINFIVRLYPAAPADRCSATCPASASAASGIPRELAAGASPGCT